MRIDEVPIVDVRGSLTVQRARLLSLLASVYWAGEVPLWFNPRMDLDDGRAAAPAASLQMTGDAAWRLLTGARYDTRQVRSSGEPALAEPLLRVRGIIV